FNLNLGCSSPSFLRQGIGAAMVKRVSRVKEVVKLINDAGFSCSLKLRLGVNAYEKEKGAYLNLINAVDASFFVVHARTAEETLDDPADFSVYAKCVATGKKIVANGDIKTKKQIAELKELGLYGAMIGRAAVANPKIFSELRV
ncbi:MAG: tRNA-dihydrouridine synthase, partial [Candidatus Micrarchaeota archaeon]